jgi:glutaminyl-tRNA synthetase
MQKPDVNLDLAAFEDACGVGVIVTPEMIETEVEKAVSAVKSELLEKRYRYPAGLLMAEVRKALKWADGKAVKSEIDVQIFDLLGPKTEADLAPPPKVEKKPKTAVTNGVEKSKTPVVATSTDDAEAQSGAATIAELMKTKVNFHKPGENYKTDGYVITDKTMDILAEHLKRTGGQVRTRFPPEPNGILHVGHAKAININFGYAAAHDGVCFLRYDDTNPEKEEEKFFTAIKDVVEWLGYKPYQITHSSDNFDQVKKKFCVSFEILIFWKCTFFFLNAIGLD